MTGWAFRCCAGLLSTHSNTEAEAEAEAPYPVNAFVKMERSLCIDNGFADYDKLKSFRNLLARISMSRSLCRIACEKFWKNVDFRITRIRFMPNETWEVEWMAAEVLRYLFPPIKWNPKCYILRHFRQQYLWKYVHVNNPSRNRLWHWFR